MQKIIDKTIHLHRILNIMINSDILFHQKYSKILQLTGLMCHFEGCFIINGLRNLKIMSPLIAW